MDLKFSMIELDADHPGYNDSEYRKRREYIARASEQYQGTVDTIPIIEYTDTEKEVWDFVAGKLKKLNEKYACERHIEGIRTLEIFEHGIPQLRDISKIIQKHTGFQMAPVKGLVPTKEFLESFGHNYFPSTQFIRHNSQPGFTFEPDMIHDVIGHSGGLCDQTITDIVREIGKAAMQSSEQQLEALQSLYWFTIEYGLCREDKQIKTFGAGNLSSYIDIELCVEDTSRHRPFYVEDVIKMPYDPTVIQKVLFVVESMEDCLDQVKDFCKSISPRNYAL